MSSAGLQKMATHIIVGKVTEIYKRELESGDEKRTLFVAEVKVEKIEKGEGLQPGELAYVRYWQSEWIGEGEPAPDSELRYSSAPRPKQRLRMYLTKNAYYGAGPNDDGGLNVIFKEGFEPLREPVPK
jgi:hypothetical protein